MNLAEYTFIVFGEEYHYNPLGVVRSLGEAGIHPDVIAYGGREHVVSSSRYVNETHHVKTVEDGYDILMRYYRNPERRAFVIACDDLVNDCLDAHYDDLCEYFWFNNAGEQGRLEHFQNKEVLSELAVKCGAKVPRSWHVNRGEVPDDIEYPVLTKPLTSYEGWKSDYYVCNTETELRSAYLKIKGEQLLLQSYIQKKNEYSVDGIVYNHGNDVFISVETEYTYLLPDYYSMSMVHRTFQNKEIQNFLNKMFRAIGFEGIFSIDMLIDENDEKWFLEINFRNSAWSYASTKLGMNLPVLWAEGMITGKIPEDARKEVPDNYIALTEKMDFNLRVRKYHQISFLQWLKEVKNADCLYVWDRHDLVPVFWTWMSPLGRMINKIKGTGA